jgi:hypothetical protein
LRIIQHVYSHVFCQLLKSLFWFWGLEERLFKNSPNLKKLNFSQKFCWYLFIFRERNSTSYNENHIQILQNTQNIPFYPSQLFMIQVYDLKFDIKESWGRILDKMLTLWNTIVVTLYGANELKLRIWVLVDFNESEV